MDHPGFFDNRGPFTGADIAARIGAEPISGDRAGILLRDVKSLDLAGDGHLSFFDNKKYLPLFKKTKASACIVSQDFRDSETTAGFLLVAKDPYRAFALALAAFYPDAMKPAVFGAFDNSQQGTVHPTAEIEEGAIIEPGAVIGREAHVGTGSRIASGAVIGYRTYVGRNCYIGPNTSLIHTIIGNNVIIHQGTAIGQDGFGFAMGPTGHLKVPQIGRVIVQDDVEIGANTTIDRGALKDTIIGEGTKIDNLVQIGHNVVVGRHCVIVAQTGISGSTTIEDFVVFGGQAATTGHIKIGIGAKIAANGKVSKDVAPGAVVAGAPAVPIKQWKQEVIALRRLASGKIKD